MKIYIVLIYFNFVWAAIVSGYVKNAETGSPIPNANIIIKGTKYGISSNSYGKFQLELIKGNYTIETSVIGFEKNIQEIVLKSDLELSIYLKTTILKYDLISVQGLFETRLGAESIDSYHKDEIKSMQTESTTELLKNIPGIDVQFAHPNGRNVNVSIRGSSDYKPGGYNNRVLVLLDEFPILIPSSGSVDWNSLPLDNLNNIEITKSAASSQYGHNSMGGVINLNTDHNNNNKKINISSGSNGSKKINFLINKKNQNWFYGNNFVFKQSNGHRFNADYNIKQYQSFIGFQDEKGRNYKLNYLISTSDIGHPGFDLKYSNKYRRSNRISQYLQLKSFYAIAKGLSMSHSTFANSFYTKYRNRTIPNWWLNYKLSENENFQVDQNTDYNDLNFGIRSELIITRLSRWIIMIGYDLDWAKSKVDLLNSIYDNPIQISIGGFMQSKYSIGSGFSFNSGIRYDYRKTNPGNNYTKRIYNNITPKLSIEYKNLNRSLLISFSKGFRAPSISELYLEHLTTYDLFVIGNPKLLAESVKSLELIYNDTYFTHYKYKIILFYNHYQNMIDFYYASPTYAINRSGVISNGYEYQFKINPFDNFNINGSLTYLNIKDLDGGTILYRPNYKGKIHFNITTSLLNISLGIYGQNKQYYEDFLDEYDQNDCECFPIKIIKKRIIPEIIISKSIQSYTTSLKISNLLDNNFELIQNYSMPRRTWQLSITKII